MEDPEVREDEARERVPVAAPCSKDLELDPCPESSCPKAPLFDAERGKFPPKDAGESGEETLEGAFAAPCFPGVW